MEFNGYLGMVFRGYWLGRAGLLRLSVGGKIERDRAPRNFWEYFTMNFLPYFTIDVGAGSPIYLRPIDN